VRARSRFAIAVVLAFAAGASGWACSTAPAPRGEPVAAEPEAFAVWPPRMPAAFDLDAVPFGRWAEYEETYLGTVKIKERVALVGKGSDGNTIETTTEMKPGEKTTFVTVFATGGDGGQGGAAGVPRVTRNAFQVNGDDPMESPPLAPGEQPYPRIDPKKLVGVETLTVRAGTFRAKHYRDRTNYGEQVDVWVDDTVWPIGVVKLTSEQKQHPTNRNGFTFELVATGGGAIAEVTKPARPFNAQVLKKRGLPWTRQNRVGPQPPARVVE
jgi:hypothetical protein